MKKYLQAAVLCSIFAASSAHSQDASEVLDATGMIKDLENQKGQTYAQDVKENLEKKGGIIGIKEIPVTKLFFVQAEQGTYLVTADGRFVIEGTLKDVWHRKTIRNLEDTVNIDRVPPSVNGRNIEEQLATFSIGDPELPRSGVIFVDPTSEMTTNALQELEKREDEQRWTVVLMPLIGGSNAVDRSRRLYCAKDQEQAKRDLIDGTNKSFVVLNDQCEEKPILLSQFMVDIFGISQLPHLIREDGLSSDGFPVEFDAWYEQE